MSGLQQGFLTIASALSAVVLNALWQDALLVVCVWLLLRAWPRINAATRYAVWSATLIAAFIVPVATTLAFFAPAQAVQNHSAATRQTIRQTTALPPERAAHREVPATRRPMVTPAAPQQEPARMFERARVTIPTGVSVAVFLLWLGFAGFAIVRLAIGLVRLEQLKRDALPLPVEYRDAMPQWLRANKGPRDVRLCVSDATDVPVAVGLFDAMILIPHSLLDRLSEPEVDQICLHELAHLRRADDWTNGLQRLISALLGWNPAALFAGQQLDLEREVACDDWVLSFIGAVRPYALCLTKMAENASWPRNPIPAPGVFATRKHISLRIERLLGAGRNIATNLSLAPAAAAVAIVGAIALAITAVAPSIAGPVAPAVAAAPAIAAHVAATAAPRIAASEAPRAAKARASTVKEVETITRTRTVAQAVTQTPQPAHEPKRVEIPATNITVPGMDIHVPGTDVNIPKISVSVPSYDGKALAEQIRRSTAGIAQHVAAGTVAQVKACVGCDYSGVNWSGRDLHGANYTGADFSRATLTGVNFSGGSFNGTDFSDANLSGASFRNARLTGCDFSHANLSGADFTGASLSGCQFTGARMSSGQMRDVLNGCKGCDFSHADLAGLDLHGVRISSDDFSGADLRGVNFGGAEVTGVDFSGAKMDGINLAGATLNGCDMSGVDLSRVDLSRTKMIGMDFSVSHSPRP
ncbi:MAG TPA: pentapeptide repeat-containing protein [Candidatus Cybelea sp.]|nr:pentapeptide repeat-containing protein [Candidatus Cybelea sp.]